MITYYQRKIKDKSLKKHDVFKVGSWIYLESPTKDEIKQITKQHDLDEGLLLDALDQYEVPRLEVDETDIYIYTRVPVKDNGMIITVPFLFVLGNNFFMTVCEKKIDFVSEFIHKNKYFFTTQKIKLLLQLFFLVVEQYNKFITQKSRKILQLRRELEFIENKDIMQLVIIEEVFNDFLSALVPTSSVLDTLLSRNIVKLYEEDEDLVEDIALGIGQLIELCRSKVKLISNLRDAYSTVMTNNLNRIFKVLTVLAIFMTVPTVLSGLYGMNVLLPLANNPYAFWFVVLIALFVTLGLYLFFKKKRWL